MATKKPKSAAPSPTTPDADVPVVALREPCPCGSGRRYKACHGRAAAQRGERVVARPFEGLPGEADWVAMRELVPSATAPLTLVAHAEAGLAAGRVITLATVLPMAWPALHRSDGSILLGLQTQTGSGDLSRDLADALMRAVGSEPGTPIPPAGLPDDGPRLQDLVDLGQRLEVTVHSDFEFWVSGVADVEGEVAESLQSASEGIIPTARLSAVDSAYWCDAGAKEHLRWVLDRDETRALDALARLHAAGAIGVGEGSRFVGSFRALGLIIPVWDLPVGTGSAPLEAETGPWLARFDEAYAIDSGLTPNERRARAGLVNRQVTLS
ncbi:MAG: topoisomerase II [Actinobacteria bacterium]|uniref:Unannotated protein n=1 Tax=freshwater metagenome TaxID=449393 RepID=A0A6J7IDP4_9ZZZZ|nr:topoisomerase II [Actinomycetota bacterium]